MANEEEEQPMDEAEEEIIFHPMEVDPESNPRIGGGTDPQTWWTGGPNVQANRITWPRSASARRPTEFKSASLVEENCRKGLKAHLKLTNDPKSKITLTSWVSALKAHRDVLDDLFFG